MMRHVFLSPHLDDVALSCGGTLAHLKSQGAAVQVITLFAGIPDPDRPLSAFAQYQHRQWEMGPQAYQARRAEDEAALACFNLKPNWLNLLDCIYRGDPERDTWYYASDDDIFGAVHPAESRLPSQIARAIAREINCPNSSNPQKILLYAPLGVGHHVDHQLVFLAALQLVRRGCYSLCFYEDYPYVQRNPGDLAETVQSCTQILSKPLEPALYFLSETDLSVKIKAVAAYVSQLQVLFGGAEAMARLVRGYACQIGESRLAERFWTVTVA